MLAIRITSQLRKPMLPFIPEISFSSTCGQSSISPRPSSTTSPGRASAAPHPIACWKCSKQFGMPEIGPSKRSPALSNRSVTFGDSKLTTRREITFAAGASRIALSTAQDTRSEPRYTGRARTWTISKHTMSALSCRERSSRSSPESISKTSAFDPKLTFSLPRMRLPLLARCSGNWSGSDKFSGVNEDVIQHGLSQFASRSVLLARVVGGKQSGAQAAVQQAVPEPEIGKTLQLTAVFQYSQIRIESDLSQRDNNLNTAKHFQFTFEEGTAVAQFQRRGLVARWRAVCRRRDPCVGKLKTVQCVAALRLGGESRFMKGPVQEVAGTISCEHTSSTISAVRARGQTENQQARRQVAEGRNRPAPVIPVEECASFRQGDVAAMADQARAAFAFLYLLIQHDRVSFATFSGFGARH